MDQQIVKGTADQLFNRRAGKDLETEVAAPAEQPAAPEPEVDRFSLPEQVRRVNGIVESIHDRREERARVVADRSSKLVAFERSTAEDRKVEEKQIAEWTAEHEAKVEKLRQEFERKRDNRMAELQAMSNRVDKIDQSLDQLRIQLEVELKKLDPDRKASK